MTHYRPTLPEPTELKNPRWLCGCGSTAPIEGPAYPLCACGLRMRLVVVDGQDYVVDGRGDGS